MKAIRVMAAITAALLAAGCEPQRSPDVPDQPKSMTPEANPPPPKAAPTPPEARQNTTLPEAMQPSPEAKQMAAGSDKNQFVALVEQKLKDLDVKITNLGEKIGSADQGAKNALANLRELRAKADAKFKELKQSGQDVWMELKPQLEVAMAELEKTCRELASRINA